MDIAQYIADLLKENHEVNLPGIGTFYSKRQPAFYDKNSNSFFPPRKELCFKPDESEPSLLINYITAVKNISGPSAEYFAESFASELKDKLNTEGKASIHPLGTLEAVSGEWILKPSSDITFSDYYGLPTIKDLESDFEKEERTQPAANIKGSEAKKTTIPSAAVSKEDRFENKAFTDSEPDTNAEVPITETRRKKSKTWLTALVILGIIGAGGAAVYITNPALLENLLKPDKNVHATAAPVSENTVEPEAKADSIMQALHAEGFYDVEKIPDTTVAQVNVSAQADTNTISSTLRIEIIGASLPSRKEAENYIHQMKKRGIDARIVEEKKGRLIKVSLGSFTDKAQADAELQRIRNEITKEAWPLTIKN